MQLDRDEIQEKAYKRKLGGPFKNFDPPKKCF